MPWNWGTWATFIYVIHDHASDRAAVVDPAWDVPAFSIWSRGAWLADHRYSVDPQPFRPHQRVEALLNHSDAQLHLLRPEAAFWDRYLDLPTLHEGGDRIRLGETEIEVLHTPGHTPGSACYRLGDQVLTGDTLFVFGCGRCDLRGGDPEQMYHTLRRLGERLPDHTLIRPGHNYGITPTSTHGRATRRQSLSCISTPVPASSITACTCTTARSPIGRKHGHIRIDDP
jgi:hydroxyacylglutathione hydrolase